MEDTRLFTTVPRLRPPKTLTEPEVHARRPGSLTIGATAQVVLAIATLEGRLALKILYKAGRRRAPRSHLRDPAAAAPPSPLRSRRYRRLRLHHPTRQRARLRRSREATGALAGRKDRAPYVTDAARAMLTEGSRPLFPFLLCEGRLPPWEGEGGKTGMGRKRAEERPMGPGSWSRVTNGLNSRGRPART